MNIFEKMSKITADISNVAKNLTVSAGKGSYKAVGEADILAAVKPIEAQYGVYSYPYSRKIVDSSVLVAESEYNGQKSTKNSLFMRLEVVYRFVNTEKPEEFIDIVTYGDGIDTGDKGCGKAMTYADKYALMKAYKIITGDDPDQYASGEYKEVQPTKATKAQIEALEKVYTGENLTRLLQANNITKIADLTYAKATELIKKLEAMK